MSSAVDKPLQRSDKALQEGGRSLKSSGAKERPVEAHVAFYRPRLVEYVPAALPNVYVEGVTVIPEPPKLAVTRPPKATHAGTALDAHEVARRKRIGPRQARRILADLFERGCPLVRRVPRSSCKASDKMGRLVIDAAAFPFIPYSHQCPAHQYPVAVRKRPVPEGFVSPDDLAELIRRSEVKHVGTAAQIADRVREWCRRGMISSGRAGQRILIPQAEADAIVAGQHQFAHMLVLDWAASEAPVARRNGERAEKL